MRTPPAGTALARPSIVLATDSASASSERFQRGSMIGPGVPVH